MFGIAAIPAAQEAASRPALSQDEIEQFLLNGKIGRARSAGNGVTNSQRAPLSDGRITHEAHIQVVDQARAIFEAGKATEVNFKDTYRYNIAGYRVARLLGLYVPVSVERSFQGKPAAFTWWIDDVLTTEEDRVKNKMRAPDPARFGRQIQTMRIFDELIQNRDRNQGNLVWTKDWTLWLIDHTRAFRLGRELRNPDQVDGCDRTLFERLKALTVEAVTKAAGTSLTSAEIAALIARRDLLVGHLQKRIAEKGEAAVLYDDATLLQRVD
jgi:hypothetical protein